MEKSQFAKAVREAVRTLPRAVCKALENVEICIADQPTPRQRQMGGLRRGDILLGLYEGVPKANRSSQYGAVLPDKITLFRGPIEGSAGSLQEIIQIIRETVWHEIAHHIGFDESQVRGMERERDEPN